MLCLATPVCCWGLGIEALGTSGAEGVEPSAAAAAGRGGLLEDLIWLLAAGAALAVAPQLAANFSMDPWIFSGLAAAEATEAASLEGLSLEKRPPFPLPPFPTPRSGLAADKHLFFQFFFQHPKLSLATPSGIHVSLSFLERMVSL